MVSGLKLDERGLRSSQKDSLRICFYSILSHDLNTGNLGRFFPNYSVYFLKRTNNFFFFSNRQKIVLPNSKIGIFPVPDRETINRWAKSQMQEDIPNLASNKVGHMPATQTRQIFNFCSQCHRSCVIMLLFIIKNVASLYSTYSLGRGEEVL